MQRRFFPVILLAAALGLGGAAPSVYSQNNAAAAAAEREAIENNFKTLTASIKSLEENQAVIQQNISALEKSISELRQELARANNNAVTQESLRRLGEQIQKVDEARVSENRKIHDAMDELHRVLKTTVESRPPPRSANPAPPAGGNTTPPPSTNEEGYEHVVQSGDTLSGIVQAYRSQNIKVTSKAIMDANPTVKWERLRVGQKLFIPKPKN